MVTIKDVSKKCGFSITTVSKALNDYSDISDKTKKTILELCDEMGYIPNYSARSLVSKKSYTIGIIFEEVTGVGATELGVALKDPRYQFNGFEPVTPVVVSGDAGSP